MRFTQKLILIGILITIKWSSNNAEATKPNSFRWIDLKRSIPETEVKRLLDYMTNSSRSSYANSKHLVNRNNKYAGNSLLRAIAKQVVNAKLFKGENHPGMLVDGRVTPVKLIQLIDPDALKRSDSLAYFHSCKVNDETPSVKIVRLKQAFPLPVSEVSGKMGSRINQGSLPMLQTLSDTEVNSFNQKAPFFSLGSVTETYETSKIKNNPNSIQKSKLSHSNPVEKKLDRTDQIPTCVNIQKNNADTSSDKKPKPSDLQWTYSNLMSALKSALRCYPQIFNEGSNIPSMVHQVPNQLPTPLDVVLKCSCDMCKSAKPITITTRPPTITFSDCFDGPPTTTCQCKSSTHKCFPSKCVPQKYYTRCCRSKCTTPKSCTTKCCTVKTCPSKRCNKPSTCCPKTPCPLTISPCKYYTTPCPCGATITTCPSKCCNKPSTCCPKMPCPCGATPTDNVCLVYCTSKVRSTKACPTPRCPTNCCPITRPSKCWNMPSTCCPIITCPIKCCNMPSTCFPIITCQSKCCNMPSTCCPKMACPLNSLAKHYHTMACPCSATTTHTAKCTNNVCLVYRTLKVRSTKACQTPWSCCLTNCCKPKSCTTKCCQTKGCATKDPGKNSTTKCSCSKSRTPKCATKCNCSPTTKCSLSKRTTTKGRSSADCHGILNLKCCQPKCGCQSCSCSNKSKPQCCTNLWSPSQPIMTMTLAPTTASERHRRSTKSCKRSPFAQLCNPKACSCGNKPSAIINAPNLKSVKPMTLPQTEESAQENSNSCEQSLENTQQPVTETNSAVAQDGSLLRCFPTVSYPPCNENACQKVEFPPTPFCPPPCFKCPLPSSAYQDSRATISPTQCTTPPPCCEMMCPCSVKDTFPERSQSKLCLKGHPRINDSTCCPKYYRPTIYTTGKNPCCHTRRSFLSGIGGHPPHSCCSNKGGSQLTTTTTRPSTTTPPQTTPPLTTSITTEPDFKFANVLPTKHAACTPTGSHASNLYVPYFPPGLSAPKVVPCSDPNCAAMHQMVSPFFSTPIDESATQPTSPYPNYYYTMTPYPSGDYLQTVNTENSLKGSTLPNAFSDMALKRGIMEKVQETFNNLRKHLEMRIHPLPDINLRNDPGSCECFPDETPPFQRRKRFRTFNSIARQRREASQNKQITLEAIQKIQQQLNALESELSGPHTLAPSNLTLQIKVCVDVINGTSPSCTEHH